MLYIYMYVYFYLFIYICICVNVCIYLFIYLFVYIGLTRVPLFPPQGTLDCKSSKPLLVEHSISAKAEEARKTAQRKSESLNGLKGWN